jgi:hypothetical protein
MIKVTIGTNTNRKEAIVDPSRTLKSVLDEYNIDYSRGGIHLDGLSIAGADLNKSFTEHGIKEDCILISVVKGDGGIL